MTCNFVGFCGSVLDTTLRDPPPPSSKVCETSFAQNPGRGAPPPTQKCAKLVLHTFGGGGPPEKCAKLPVREGEATEAL